MMTSVHRLQCFSFFLWFVWAVMQTMIGVDWNSHDYAVSRWHLYKELKQKVYGIEALPVICEQWNGSDFRRRVHQSEFVLFVEKMDNDDWTLLVVALGECFHQLLIGNYCCSDCTVASSPPRSNQHTQPSFPFSLSVLMVFLTQGNLNISLLEANHSCHMRIEGKGSLFAIINVISRISMLNRYRRIDTIGEGAYGVV